MAKNNKGLIIGLLVGLTVVGGGIGLFYHLKNKGKGKDQYDEDEVDLEEEYSSENSYSPDTVDLFSSLPVGKFPLAEGKKSKLVFVLQKYLNCRFSSGLVVDGIFGAKTEVALFSSLGTNIVLSKNNMKQLVEERGALGTCEAVLLSKISEVIK